ncbi:MAG: helix-turn-helix domain-containing protein, partial [Candidatus Desulfofervidus auxilii]|nr:helix-turn-helix domain-containing protein [Candidatus Desulfofervidus auxilii]
MKILKIKLYPKAKQEELLRQFLGNTRFVWNKLVEMKVYSFIKGCKKITELKEKYEFLQLSPSHTLQQMARKLNQAYKNYKKGYTNKPSFKRKKNFDGILIFPEHFQILDKKIKIPKLGWIKFKDKISSKEKFKYIQQHTKQIWIKENAQGFFAYLVFDDSSSQ